MKAAVPHFMMTETNSIDNTTGRSIISNLSNTWGTNVKINDTALLDISLSMSLKLQPKDLIMHKIAQTGLELHTCKLMILRRQSAHQFIVA